MAKVMIRESEPVMYYSYLVDFVYWLFLTPLPTNARQTPQRRPCLSIIMYLNKKSEIARALVSTQSSVHVDLAMFWSSIIGSDKPD